MTRHVVVNADDFGLTDGVNAGVIDAHLRGIVTSTSLMVRAEAAAAAAQLAAQHPSLGVGLHLDLGEWVHGAAGWEPAYVVVDTDDADAVAVEITAQLTAFEVLLGRPPTHLDSHQHVHRADPVRRLLIEAGDRLGVPVRQVTPGLAYRGDFYGQTGAGQPYPEGITVDALLAVMRSVDDGWTEIACHPGRDTAELGYGREREQELAVLCDEMIVAAVRDEGLVLSSFDTTTRAQPPRGAPRRGAEREPLSSPRVGRLPDAGRRDR